MWPLASKYVSGDYNIYSCISQTRVQVEPPFLSSKLGFFIISSQRSKIQTDRNFPKVNLLFQAMY